MRRTIAALATALTLAGIGIIASPGLDDVKAQADTEAAKCLRLLWFTDCLRLF